MACSKWLETYIQVDFSAVCVPSLFDDWMCGELAADGFLGVTTGFGELGAKKVVDILPLLL